MTQEKFNNEGKLIIDALGRSEFDYVWKYYDGSTKTRVGGKSIITEKDGTLFVDALNRKEFDDVDRLSSSNTMSIVGGRFFLTEMRRDE